MAPPSSKLSIARVILTEPCSDNAGRVVPLLLIFKTSFNLQSVASGPVHSQTVRVKSFKDPTKA